MRTYKTSLYKSINIYENEKDLFFYDCAGAGRHAGKCRTQGALLLYINDVIHYPFNKRGAEIVVFSHHIDRRTKKLFEF
jgi:hypothetical protein